MADAQAATWPTVAQLSGTSYFRVQAANHLAPLLQITPQQVFEVLEAPRQSEHGDIALPVPRLNKFSKVKGNPAELAAQIAAKFVPSETLTSALAAGPFVNFRYNKKLVVQHVLKEVHERGATYGFLPLGQGKSVVVEYSSPNIAKPFHAGHLRSTIIGNFIANVYEGMGYHVTRINYLGDWGKQYGLLAVGYEKFGSEAELAADPIKHLYHVYVAINREAGDDDKAEHYIEIHDKARAYFKRMEDGDEEALALWRRFRDLSIAKYKEIYARLNVHFDIYSGESLYGEAMKVQVADLKAKNIVQEEKGALICDLSKHKLGTVVIEKRDGTTLYITRDIAAAVGRWEEFKFEKMFYVVAAQQDLHFQQLFKVLDLMGHEFYKLCEHVNFGMVLGMSTRKGQVVFLEDILEGSQLAMHEVMRKNTVKYDQLEDPEHVADIVGLSAVIVQDMSARRVKDYTFDMDRMTSFEGDTGPYLQYTHTRLCSIERKFPVTIPFEQTDLSVLTEPEAITLCDVLGRYPAALQQAMEQLEPINIVSFALDLAHAISATVEKVWVINQTPEVAAARVALYRAARIALGNALRVIGLVPLERM